jgi:hypothetical protein
VNTRGYAVAIASYSGVPDPLCSQSLNQLQPAAFHIRSGLSDVALARNTVLTAVVDDPDCGEAFDVVLLVDDDMVFTLQDAERLIARARETGRVHSAAYSTADSRLVVTTWPEWLPHKPGPKGELQFLTGLGFMAVPIAELRRLQLQRPRVRVSAEISIVPFCVSGPDFEHNCWVSEDHAFCRAVGGVLLEPICVGHVKKVHIYPVLDDVLRKLAGGQLPADPESVPIAGVRVPEGALGVSP